jgi:hypothetical protein
MEGLAQELAGAAPAPQAPAAQGALPTVEEVIVLLMQGRTPEELVQMGVPPEMIMQAIEILEQQMAAQPQGGGGMPQQGPAAPQEPGLAQSMMGR